MVGVSRVHLEGMGVIGSLLAIRLEEEGVDFTWHDTHDRTTAWKASTGCVFPTGDPEDMRAVDGWLGLLNSHSLLQEVLEPVFERGLWCYISKHPPHSGVKQGVEERDRIGPIRVSNALTYHFNSQRLVPMVRERYEDRERDHAPRNKRLIIATHGTFSAVRYTWGWSARVKVKMSRKLAQVQKEMALRPCIYLRQGYQMNYLYPCPGTEWWYAGTAAISQRTPKRRALPDLTVWGETLKELTGGHVHLLRAPKRGVRQGWRPVAEKDAKLVRKGLDEEGRWRLVCRPQGGNGYRHFPLLAEAVLEAL